VLRVAYEKPGPIELDPSTEEYAVAAAASLAKHFLDRGWSLGMITYPNRQKRELAQADRGERQRDRILSILAVTHARGSIPLAQILTAESVYLSRNVLAIVITPSVNSEWIAALRHLSTRGARTTAILIDASTFTPQGATGASVDRAAADLVSSHIPTYRVGLGDSFQAALSQPTSRV
jgi:uncharacterized protein (DUF58 family)